MINYHPSFTNRVVKQMFRKITAVLLLLLACTARGEGEGTPVVPANDNVLLWWYNDPQIREVDGSKVYAGDLVGRGVEAKRSKVNAVRVSVTDGEGNKVYLNLSDVRVENDPHRSSWQSWVALPDDDGDFFAGPGYADLAGLNLDSTGLTFAMELGNYSTGDDVDWIVLASSEGSTLSNLMAGGHIISSELSMQGSKDWKAGGYVVPEPSSGLLVLMGGALLALRRRRKSVRT